MLGYFRYKEEDRESLWHSSLWGTPLPPVNYFQMMDRFNYFFMYLIYLWDISLGSKKAYYTKLMLDNNPNFSVDELGPLVWNKLFMYLMHVPFRELPLYINTESKGVLGLIKFRINKGY